MGAAEDALRTTTPRSFQGVLQRKRSRGKDMVADWKVAGQEIRSIVVKESVGDEIFRVESRSIKGKSHAPDD